MGPSHGGREIRPKGAREVAQNAAAEPANRLRVRIFVDFWNFSLSLRDKDDNFRADWNGRLH
jgi:hypothetical protein